MNDGVLIVQGKEIKLPYPAVQALDYQGLIVVRVDPEVGQIFNRNVFALDANGGVKWQITESPHGTEVDKPYTYITISEDNQLIAGNWNGVDYAVTLDDGSITPISFIK